MEAVVWMILYLILPNRITPIAPVTIILPGLAVDPMI
jgi:hypothetical protein